MMRFVLYIGLLVTLFSCKKAEIPEGRIAIGIGSPNAFVIGADYINHSGGELFVDLKIGIVGGGDGRDITSFTNTVFQDQSFGNHELIVESVTLTEQMNEANYSNLLAIDQSRDWDDLDAFNMHTKALNKAILDLYDSDGNEMALSSFRNVDGEDRTSFWFEGSGETLYEQTYEYLAQSIYNMNNFGGGDANTLEALDYYLDIVVDYASLPNRHITLICQDVVFLPSTISYSGIINKAIANEIKVNIIVINDGYSTVLSQIAARTGGFYNTLAHTPTYTTTLGDYIDKSTPLISSIDRILSQNNTYYTVRVKLEKNVGTWSSGSFVFDPYLINLFDDAGEGYLNNYLPFYVQIP
jgi:hypothetical protein